MRIINRNRTVLWIGGVGLLIIATVGWVVNKQTIAEARHDGIGNPPDVVVASVGQNGGDYCYDRANIVPLREFQRSAGEQLRSSVKQWPDSPCERMHAMSDRLCKVVKAINTVAGTSCLGRLGHSGRAAVVNEDGTITIDTSIVWRLSEDALAALIAHEVSHELLGHRDQIARLEAKRNEPGHEQRLRNIELAADEMAGRLLAQTSYEPSGFAELLQRVGETGRNSQTIDQYYPNEQRWVAFQQAYMREGRMMKQKVTASQPGMVAATALGNEG